MITVQGTGLGLLPFSCVDYVKGPCDGLDAGPRERVRSVQRLYNVFARQLGFTPVRTDGVVDASVISAANKIGAYLASRKIWGAAQPVTAYDLMAAAGYRNLDVLLAAAIAKAKPSGWESFDVSISADGVAPLPPGADPGGAERPRSLWEQVQTYGPLVVGGAAAISLGYLLLKRRPPAT